MIKLIYPPYSVQAACIRTGIVTPIEYLHYEVLRVSNLDTCEWCGLSGKTAFVGTYRFCAACEVEAME